MKGSNKYRDYFNERMKDPEFKKEYDALLPELAIIQAMAEARDGKGLTREELSEKSGLSPRSIAALENGSANPSVRTLQKLAEGLGKTLKIEFV